MERLYVTLPTHQETERAVNMLLLKRIAISQMGVVAKEGTLLGKLPEAKLSIRSDIKHSLMIGALIGGLLGVGAGLYLHSQLHMALSGYMIVTTVLGAVFGAWACSMIGMTTDNTELQPFMKDIADGQFLLVIDVPMEKVEEIKTILHAHDPNAKVTCFS